MLSLLQTSKITLDKHNFLAQSQSWLISFPSFSSIPANLPQICSVAVSYFYFKSHSNFHIFQSKMIFFFLLLLSSSLPSFCQYRLFFCQFDFSYRLSVSLAVVTLLFPSLYIIDVFLFPGFLDVFCPRHFPN